MAEYVMDAALRGVRGYVCVANTHVLTTAVFNSQLRKALASASLVTPDGMPLVWFLRSRGHSRQNRVYGPDLTIALLKLAQRRKARVFFYGGSAETLRILIKTVKIRFPRLKIAGSYSPPFRERFSPHEEIRHARIIDKTKPHLVFVGLGAPKQEIWMHRMRPKIKAPFLLGVGAAFDFIAGRKPSAPRWMKRSGLEWLFRLSTEPSRLWWRYLYSIPLFAVLASLQYSGLWTLKPVGRINSRFKTRG
jgi:N-acetylglucosaminyldiphosphoundecaprenol N-acetyl-beta-D-mannosaminyltransferase